MFLGCFRVGRYVGDAGVKERVLRRRIIWGGVVREAVLVGRFLYEVRRMKS